MNIVLARHLTGMSLALHIFNLIPNFRCHSFKWSSEKTFLRGIRILCLLRHKTVII